MNVLNVIPKLIDHGATWPQQVKPRCRKKSNVQYFIPLLHRVTPTWQTQPNQTTVVNIMLGRSSEYPLILARLSKVKEGDG